MPKVAESKRIDILLIQKEEDRTFTPDILGKSHVFSFTNSIDGAKSLLNSQNFDIVFLDLNLTNYSGIDTLKYVLRIIGTLPVVILIAKNDENLGIESMQYGAQDYLFKDEPLSRQMVSKVVKYSIERNKNVRILKQHENSLKLAQEIAKMGSWTWYPGRDKFIPSEEFLKIFNIPGLEASSSFLSFLKNVHPEDQLKIKRALTTHSNKLESFSLEFRIFSAENDLKYILLRGNLQEEQRLNEPTYYGTGQDITELKASNENLLQKNRFLEMTGEIAGLGGWELNLKTRKMFWSKACYAIHGMPKSFEPSIDEIILLFDEKDRDQLQDRFEKAISEKRALHFQSLIHINGTTKWVQYIAKIIYEDNEPVTMSGIVQDISDSKRQLEKIRVRAMMLDNVGEAAIAVDRNWKVIFWNKAAEKLLKFTRAETLGKPLALLELVNLPKENIKEAFNQLRNGQSVQGEYEMIDKYGRRFPAWSSNAPIFDENGRVEALLSIVRDISGDKDHLRKLEESENRFRNIFELSPLGIGLIDLRSKKWIEANDKLLKLLGYNSDELSKLTYIDITPDIYRNQDELRAKNLLENGIFGPYQKEYIKKDGTLLKVVLTGFLVTDSDNNQKAWTHVLDISELEEKTETLRQTEERFNDYVENSTDVILSVDAEGTVAYVSVNVENMLGYDWEEMIGKSVFDITHPEDINSMIKSLNLACHKLDSVGRITARIKNKNGHYIWVQAEGNMRKAPDGSLYGILIARDIDNERKSELRVREQNKILKDIAFIQSHILRRPLANILGILDISSIKEKAPPESVRLLDIIKSEAEIMDQIVARIVEKSTEINKLSDEGE